MFKSASHLNQLVRMYKQTLKQTKIHKIVKEYQNYKQDVAKIAKLSKLYYKCSLHFKKGKL